MAKKPRSSCRKHGRSWHRWVSRSAWPAAQEVEPGIGSRACRDQPSHSYIHWERHPYGIHRLLCRCAARISPWLHPSLTDVRCISSRRKRKRDCFLMSKPDIHLRRNYTSLILNFPVALLMVISSIFIICQNYTYILSYFEQIATCFNKIF